ncbi:hypothetical protein KAJ89_00735 [Candidatus Parcubacteria bacterium]|nr:hypothetical protein [Candidatus Parcubacteria bacterium]
MNLNQRRILYILFIIAFLTITPLVSLYATGLRIGNGFRIQKTGILILDTEPKGANISLNGKQLRRPLARFFDQTQSHITTPTKIKNLLPKEYDVRLELPGYWPWQKKLVVEPGQSTYAEDVVLFKNDVPRLIQSGRYDNIALSPNNKYLMARGDDSLTLIDLKNENIHTVVSTSTGEEAINYNWSPDNKHLIANSYLFDLNNHAKDQDLSSIINPKITKIKWQNNDSLIYKQGNSLQNYNINNKKIETVKSELLFDDFLVKNSNLFTVTRGEQNSQLLIQNIKDDELNISFDLPKAQYHFAHPNHNLLNLYDDKHQILYLIDPSSTFKILRDAISNIKESVWIDNNSLLFANDFEIWLYDVNHQNRTLLTRISEPIKKIIWHPSNNYVIYATNKNINTIELDKRDKFNITRLLEFEDIKGPVLDLNGKTLYFSARIGNQQGIYKLTIQ